MVVVAESALGRKWKSEMRRSAHLLAEKLLAAPLTALSLGGFLVEYGGDGEGRYFGVQMPKAR